MGKSPFTMPGSGFYGKSNQSVSPGKYSSPAKVDEGKEVQITDSEGNLVKKKEKNETPPKKNEKPKLNQFGETPEQYKKRVTEMGLRGKD